MVLKPPLRRSDQIAWVQENWTNVAYIKKPCPAVQMAAFLQSPLALLLIKNHDVLVRFLQQHAKPIFLTSPLPYPGGKSRAITQVRNLMSTVCVRVVSVFAGGSSVEIDLSLNHKFGLVCYDAFEALINFWQHASAGDTRLVELVEAHQQRMAAAARYDWDAIFFDLKNTALAGRGLQSAAAFYAAIFVSFNNVFGTSFSGVKFDRFIKSDFGSLRDFMSVASELPISWQHGDFRDTIPIHPDDFLFLDPPYHLGGARDNLYGPDGSLHRGFDHEALAKLLRDHGYWLLCYNDDPYIRNLYQGYTILKPHWAYTMGKRPCSELFILSHRLEAELVASKNPTFLKLLAASTLPLPANDNEPPAA